MRAKDVLVDAVPKADLIIVDEAHRVSPMAGAINGLLMILTNLVKKMRVLWV
jgi:hypothetical protein